MSAPETATAAPVVPAAEKPPSPIMALLSRPGAGLVICLALVVVVASFLNSAFIGLDNVSNMLVTASLLAIVAFGMTFVIGLGGLDLSIGSVQALAAILAAQVANNHGVVPAVLAGVGAGLLAGLVNGAITVRWAVPSFIATLGMASIIRGGALVHVNGASVIVSDLGFNSLGSGRVLGVPYIVWAAALAFVVLLALLKLTAFGRHVLAVGGNLAAARSAGINAGRISIIVYGMSGMLAGLGGVLLAAQLQYVDGSMGLTLDLQVIAIAVLGGASLAGGRASLTGTLLAALLISAVAAALNILNVRSFYQYLTTGLLLVVALAFDSLRGRRSQTGIGGAA